MLGRSLADLLLAPTALAKTAATRAELFEAARAAAGPKGIVEDLVHEGDPREPAELHALFASPGGASSRATILFLHGKGGCGAEWRRDATRALRLGYNVLVPELRAHAPSTGPRITYGYFERTDVALLVEAAAERHGVDMARLGIDGCSMGSLIALHLAASSSAVRALWLQAPFGNLTDMAVQYVHRATMLPRALAEIPARLAVLDIERSTGLSLTALDPVEAARLVSCPTVVVHGENDSLVPVSYSTRLYDALAGEKELWRVPRCGHCHHLDEPQAIRSREYVARWRALFEKSLPTARHASGARVPSPARPRGRA